MKKLGKEYLILILTILFCWQAGGLAWALEQKVISWGADLTGEEKETIWSYFPSGLRGEDPAQIILTNREEKNYLQGLVPNQVIGTKAISSVYLEILPAGSGIQVETKNVSWVNQEMFINALATAGLKDAKVIAAAPYDVSGTAALAGIFKAFELATGKSLSPEAKKIAGKELITTGKLGEAIGNKEKAAELIAKVKEEIVRKQITDPKTMEQVIIQISDKLQLDLTPDQIQQVLNLMQGISSLNLNLEQISGQIKVMSDQLGKVWESNQEVKNLVQKMYDFLQKLAEQIIVFLGKYFGPEKS